MSAAISPLKLAVILAAAAGCVAGIGVAAAEPMPGTENGRYALAPAGDSVVRLDTRTGAVSNCSDSDTGWACYAVPDERAAMDAEIGRLQAENERLKEQLATREATVQGKVDEPKIDEPLPKSDKQSDPKMAEQKPAEPKAPDPKVADGGRKLEIPLPSDQDVDRLMSFMERAWRRLVEMANRVQKDALGRI
jgi:hypothetical protein